ncbi:MAG: M20/M25/M40 family metallo-hydrolase [Kofleriaceae bacterium]
MTRCLVFALALVGACRSSHDSRSPRTGDSSWVDDTSSFGAAAARSTLADRFREPANRIITAARADREAFAKLRELTDQIGHRMSGSPQLAAAVAWAQHKLTADGHPVTLDAVLVPHWVRGVEQATLVKPIARPLHIIGLGGTVPTPKGGLVAPVIVIRSWDELDQRAADIKGKLVLFDVAMPAWTEKTSGYGDVSRFRSRGPSRAASYGAVGVLMRSVTGHSLRTPHTGALSYDEAQPKIPAAAVTVEDAALIARLAETGPVSVRLRLESKQLPDAPSHNVLAELKGRERPDEIVVIGAHLDSWDVGQGAHDDGAGCVMMMQALTVLKRLGLVPRRTIRVVLFTNEENGLRGGKEYAVKHAAEAPNTVLALEADSGGFAPRGFSLETKPEVIEQVRRRVADISTLLAPLGVHQLEVGHGGADLMALVPLGVPTAGLITDGRRYFDYHHTEADTLDKVDPATLADDVAAVAVLAYIVAEMPERLDAP